MDQQPPTRKSQVNSRKLSRCRHAGRQEEIINPPDTTVIRGYCEALLDDIHNQLPSVYRAADSLLDKRTISRRLDNEGVTFATSTLPVIFDGVVTHLEGGIASFPGFKTLNRNGITYPAFLSRLVKCIFCHPKTVEGTKAFECLYQISYAFKKVKGPYKTEKLLEQLKEFIEVDASLKEYDHLSEPLRAISKRAQCIITETLKGLNPFDPDQAVECLPQPGPGATNTPLKPSKRYEARLDVLQISDVLDLREWYEPPFSPPRGFALNLSGSPKQNVIRQHKRSAEKPKTKIDTVTSRFKFVPKTNKKARCICIEENEVQWLQQALRKMLVKRIENHPLTKGCVNFTSQKINQDLALIASQTGDLATLDMSSASDRISRRLVSYLFSGNKPLLDFILACSTEMIELPDLPGLNFIDVLPINKIAPMGSAICFPIMALVHFALIKAIIEFSAVPRPFNRKVYVYGDDIIIDQDCVQAVYDYLPLYGMRFNETKSFSQSRFRESCGLHAYEGCVVTPVRFKTACKNLRLSDVPGLLGLEEAFFNKGFRKTAEKLRISVQRVCIQHNIKDFYAVDPTSQLFGFKRQTTETTIHEFVKCMDSRIGPKSKSTWHTDYQCKQFRVPIVTDYKDESPPLVGDPGYLRWLCTQGRSCKVVEDCSPDKKFIRWKMLPESALGFRLKTDERRKACILGKAERLFLRIAMRVTGF